VIGRKKALAWLESRVILYLPLIRERMAMADFSEGYFPKPDVGLGYFGDRRLQKRGSLR
jgi:hypothetical protein